MNAQDSTKHNNIEVNQAGEDISPSPPLLSDLHSPVNGGQMTISPPAKVKIQNYDEYHVLASGIDSLNLAINVNWGESPPPLFLHLGTLKERAKENGSEIGGSIKAPDGTEVWRFTIPPYGTKGYEWILNGKDFTFKIGSWLKPNSMPSMLAEIRSETLWNLGAKEAVRFILHLLFDQGGKGITIKPSRVDLCVDFLAPITFWKMDLINNRITRAKYAAPHLHSRKLTGISIGKGKLSARLYDKPLEIRQQSKKFWMFDIWGLEDVPEGKIIIRVEFQFRREILVELGLIGVEELFSTHMNAWKYCSEKWLKFQTNPDKHHTQRKTMPWWEIVQNGFAGAQGAFPLVRNKAIRQQKERYLNQILGAMSSLASMNKTEAIDDLSISFSIGESISSLMEYKKELEKNGKSFSKIVRTKIAKNQRLSRKQYDAFLERRKYGFPTQT